MAALSKFRLLLVDARVNQKAMMQSDQFLPPGDIIAQETILDGYLDPTEFGSVALQNATQEMHQWSSAWAYQMTALVTKINSGSPKHWMLKTDDLMLKENEMIMNSLLTNPDYKQVSAAVAELTSAVALLKDLNSDQCGPCLHGNDVIIAGSGQPRDRNRRHHVCVLQVDVSDRQGAVHEHTEGHGRQVEVGDEGQGRWLGNHNRAGVCSLVRVSLPLCLCEAHL